MPKIESHNDGDTGAEPAPRFATGAEIELAQKLRNQLEQRYLRPVSIETDATPAHATQRLPITHR